MSCSAKLIRWAAMVIVLAVWGDDARAATIRTVALTGEPAPGTDPGVVFEFFPSRPVINNAGQVAFESRLTGPGVSDVNNEGIWSELADTLRLVVRTGDPAPGTNKNFTDVDAAHIDRSGQVAFRGTVPSSPISFEPGIWSENGGSLHVVAREGDPAPGTGTSFGENFRRPVYSTNGHTAFGVSLSSFSDGSIWLEHDGGLQLVARTGDPAPGTGPGVDFSFDSNSTLQSVVVNGLGQVAFTGNVTGPGIDASNSAGVWSGAPGELRLVARDGDPAPGTPLGVVLNIGTTTSSPAINDAGQTAFASRLSGPGVIQANGQGIWSEGSGVLSLVARADEQAPGVQAGVNFKTFQNFPVINGAGDTAFVALLTDNSIGIWTEGDAGLRMVARSQESAPGTPSGVNFSGFFMPAFNGAGQTAFRASVDGPGITRDNDRGLWAEDAFGNVELIVREGDPFQVSPGDVRIVELVSFIDMDNIFYNSGNQDGLTSAFNDLGQVVFELSFTDGTEGIFVSNAVAIIPEPATLLLVGIGLLGILSCMARRQRVAGRP